MRHGLGHRCASCVDLRATLVFGGLRGNVVVQRGLSRISKCLNVRAVFNVPRARRLQQSARTQAQRNFVTPVWACAAAE